jgi:hypothetical protein
MEDKSCNSVVTIVYSSKLIGDVINFIASYGDVYTARDDYTKKFNDNGDKNYQKTNHKIITMASKTYQALVDAGYGERSKWDFYIQPYQIRRKNLPPKECSYTLFIPIPNIYNLNVSEDLKEIELIVHEKLDQVVRTGLITEKDYKVHFPAKSNDQGYHGYCIVTFMGTVPKDNCVKVKIILDMSKFKTQDGRESICHVAWCRISSLNQLNRGYSKRVIQI